MYVYNTITFESVNAESSFSQSGISRGDTDQVRIRRSSGQGQGHRSIKGRKSLLPQCKTSIANNSGFVKHTTMKFARSMGFSDIVDRMVWLPSLSRDRKWPSVTKCTHSRVVGPRLEGNLVAIVLSCTRWNLLLFIRYFVFKKMGKF